GWLERFQLGLDGFGDDAGIGALEHQRDPDRDLAPTVHRGGGASQLPSVANLADIGDGDGDAVSGGADHDGLEIVEAVDDAVGSDDDMLAMVLDVTSDRARA